MADPTTREQIERFYMEMARLVATRATCPRRAVGSVITSGDNRLLSIGYNGAPRKTPHCTDAGCIIFGDNCVRAVHAELNAILNLENRVARHATLYTTSLPCIRCAAAIAQAGITAIVFDDPYGGPEEQAAVIAIFQACDIQFYHFERMLRK